MDDAPPLSDALAIFATDQAPYLAAGLFFESFRQPFPVPPAPVGGTDNGWRQYVALYRWPDGRFETVGFCNWIRFEDVYLEGGLCVRPNFYRRMPAAHWDACREAGGLAQMMMATAAQRLDDCAAWFGFCGDRKSLIVNLRFGYVETDVTHLIVKWFADPPDAERRRIIASVAKLGPF